MRASPTGVVYFAQVGGPRGPVKIGWTRDLESRMGSLRTDHWKPVEVLATFAGSMREEALLHRTFAAERIAGEWFRPSRRLRKVIDDIERARLTNQLVASKV